MGTPSLPVLGLTGAVGAGKSTVAAECERLGCRVHDVDRMGHDALSAESVREAVLALLGPTVAASGGGLDRAAVARVVFADRALLARLEAVVHPWVAERLGDELARPAAPGTRADVIDCALLFESGLDRVCDTTICVTADAASRRRRVASGRGWSAEETARREAMQLPETEKRARADRVLSNDGALDELRRATQRLLDELAPVTSPAQGAGRRSQG